MNFFTPAFMLNIMQLLRSLLFLGAHGYALAWIFHRLSPQAVMIDVKTVVHYMIKIFTASLLTMFFMMLVFLGVLMITAQIQCVPFQSVAQNVVGNSFLIAPMSLISLCITTLVQIILIELPPHVSKRAFMAILFVVNGSIGIASWLAQMGLDKLFI